MNPGTCVLCNGTGNALCKKCHGKETYEVMKGYNTYKVWTDQSVTVPNISIVVCDCDKGIVSCPRNINNSCIIEYKKTLCIKCLGEREVKCNKHKIKYVQVPCVKCVKGTVSKNKLVDGECNKGCEKNKIAVINKNGSLRFTVAGDTSLSSKKIKNYGSCTTSHYYTPGIGFDYWFIESKNTCINIISLLVIIILSPIVLLHGLLEFIYKSSCCVISYPAIMPCWRIENGKVIKCIHAKYINVSEICGSCNGIGHSLIEKMDGECDVCHGTNKMKCEYCIR